MLDNIAEKQKDMSIAEATLANASEQAATLLNDIQKQRSLITTRSLEVDNIVVELKQSIYQWRTKLSSNELGQLAIAKVQRDNIVATTTLDISDVRSKLWKNGSIVRVAFLDGSNEVHAIVEDIANKWLDGTGLKFGFIENDRAAEICISFACSGNWSYIGVDAIVVPSQTPTMCLNSLDELKDRSNPSYKKIILTEFGHALGLINEVQNSNASIPWNKAVVYQELAREGITREIIDANMFSTTRFRNYRPFDPQSVMMVNIPRRWLLGGHEGYEGGSDLSAGDREFIRKLYPPR